MYRCVGGAGDDLFELVVQTDPEAAMQHLDDAHALPWSWMGLPLPPGQISKTYGTPARALGNVQFCNGKLLKRLHWNRSAVSYLRMIKFHAKWVTSGNGSAWEWISRFNWN